MNCFTKLRAMHLKRRKSFQIILAVELLALIIGIISLFGKNAVYVYNAEDIPDLFESFSQQQSGFSLPRGTYRVQLYYTTDTDGVITCEVEDTGLGKGFLRTNGCNLYSGLDHTDIEMWLLRDSRELMVHTNYSGEGSLVIQRLVFIQTNAWNRIILFLLFCVSVAVDALYCYIQYDRTYKISAEHKSITLGLIVTILFASLPLTVDYTVGSGDLVYHLMRVEGIKDGILNGQFPVRISPEWQQGYGYESPIFYGETILYLAAIFRLIGFTVSTSYQFFMLIITVATVLTAYYSFKKIFRDARIGLFCSMLYTLSIYRIYKTHITSSWGEVLGIMLLPLIVYGFWRIFTQDVNEESYKRSWIPLTVGYTLMFQSHLLTCEIAGFFALIMCLVLWRRTFRIQTFKVLAKAVFFSVLLSAWFMVPFVDYMLTGDFVIHHVSGRTIQDRGLYVAHLLFTYFLDGGNVFFPDLGMANTAAVGVGIAPFTSLIILGGLCCFGKTTLLEKKDRALGAIAGIFASLAMLMSLNLFPWDKIQSISQVTATLVSSVQFPNRFLTIANVMLAVVAGVVMRYLMFQGKKWQMHAFVGGMVCLVTISALHLQEGVLDKMPPLRFYNSAGMGTGYIAGAEYLPYGADASQFMYHDPVCTGYLYAADYTKMSLGAKAHMVNPGMDVESAGFPLLFYKGYHAWGENGQELNCYAGNRFEVTVDIPSGYDGEVNIGFSSPWYWRAGELVTLVTLLVILGMSLRRVGGNR